MTHVLQTHFPESFRRACWATYIRCHDDIGWAITEEDAEPRHRPMTGPGHRGFLADFYNGSFPGSFARGADFQVERRRPATGAPTAPSPRLAGLETALETGDDRARSTSPIDRILLGHALIASFGGMPLIYMGDEIGLTNDRSYLADPVRAATTDAGCIARRWTGTRAKTIGKGKTPAARIHAGTRAILAVRKATRQLSSHIPDADPRSRPAGLLRRSRGWTRIAPVTCLFNFTEVEQRVDPEALELDPDRAHVDLLTDAPVPPGAVVLPPYGRLWLRPDRPKPRPEAPMAHV